MTKANNVQDINNNSSLCLTGLGKKILLKNSLFSLAPQGFLISPCYNAIQVFIVLFVFIKLYNSPSSSSFYLQHMFVPV